MDKPSLNNPYMERLRFTDEYRLNKQEPKSDIRIRFNPVVCSTGNVYTIIENTSLKYLTGHYLSFP